MKALPILCGVAFATVICFAASRQIHVTELRETTVIGLLGKPLGSRTVIAGSWADFAMTANPLTIVEVDGSTLSNAVAIEIRGVPLRRGTRYKIEGYESGEYYCDPRWVRPDAQAYFQWHSFFVATKLIEPEKP